MKSQGGRISLFNSQYIPKDRRYASDKLKAHTNSVCTRAHQSSGLARPDHVQQLVILIIDYLYEKQNAKLRVDNANFIYNKAWTEIMKTPVCFYMLFAYRNIIDTEILIEI